MNVKKIVDNWKKSPELENYIGGVKPSTQRVYKHGIRRYMEYTGMTPQQLIDEAEEDRRKPRRQRGAPERRLQKFHTWLLNDVEHRDRWGNKLGKKGLGAYNARVMLQRIKVFYERNGFPVSWRPPKAAPKKENRRLELSPRDVRKMILSTRSTRDRSLILTGYQGGFDSDTVCTLNIGDLPNGVVDAIKAYHGDVEAVLRVHPTPWLLHIVREKEGVDYHTCLGRDAAEALIIQLWERMRDGEALELAKPLYKINEYKTARNNLERRMTPNLTHIMMRKVGLKAGVITKEQLRYSDFNTAGYHALRKSFIRRLKDAGMPRDMVEYMAGHQLAYGGAYDRPSPRKLLEKYREYEHVLSVANASSLGEVEEAIAEIKKSYGRVIEDLQEQNKAMEKRLEKMEAQQSIILKTLEKRSTRGTR